MSGDERSNDDRSDTAIVQLREPDDEADKRAMRQQHRMDTATLSDSTPRHRLSSAWREEREPVTAQVAEIYRQCLALHLKNRINAKNAFDLTLIDVLPAVSNMEACKLDFTYVGKLIAVAARIYGFRVDNVCQQTHQLYNEVLRSEGKRAAPADTISDEGEDEGATDEPGPAERRVKPRAKRQRTAGLQLDMMIEKVMDKITGHIEDYTVTPNPVYSKTKELLSKSAMAAALSINFPILNDFGNMDMASRWSDAIEPIRKNDHFNSGALGDILKLTEEHEGKASALSSRFAYPDATSVPNFEDFVRELSDDANITSTLDATLSTSMDDLVLDVTIKDTDNPMFESDALPAAPCASQENADDHPTGRCLDFPTMLAALSRKRLEYSYVQAERLPITCGAKNWKQVLQKLKRVKGIPPVARKRREQVVVRLELNFRSYEAFVAEAERGPKETTLKRVHLDKYSSMENSLDPEIDFDPKQLSCFFLLPNKGMIRREPDQPLRKFILASKNRLMINHLHESDEGDDDEMAELPADGANPFVTDLNAALEEDGIAMNDASMDENGNNEQNEPMDLATPSQPELAKLAQPKRINVSLMRKVISLLLTRRDGTENDDKENESFQPQDFSRIYHVLAKQPKLKKDLTVHSAFVCMLHMCNENSYRLLPKGDVDFTVSNV